jgi:hypothetical protein
MIGEAQLGLQLDAGRAAFDRLGGRPSATR